ncbi:CGNR zinc finger domain-containing protein [Amycolatopsis sp. H20-H5]|uniref:CGNR zinc finger domain-containing protein n=1 Tax=Amycolatopsis sp. H20-H5 TaxID=3046309 RepID=UPI002DBA562B|nr:CGNR zinc finger domain-containing protein [Amycolatopsis sp. H20-H5]MEC3981677.1 CGNR zinc finger domain-containing protein [Amycolatopsis sp. H20-H5]
MTGTERHNLAVCPEQDCRGVFTNHGARRRWCPDPACANRGRVRAHRERQKAGPTAAKPTESGAAPPDRAPASATPGDSPAKPPRSGPRRLR